MNAITSLYTLHKKNLQLLRPTTVRGWLISWIALISIMSGFVTYMVYHAVDFIQTHHTTIATLETQLKTAQDEQKHMTLLEKDETIANMMPRLETLMEERVIEKWCEDLPLTFGLSYQSPLLSIRCQTIPSDTSRLKKLLHILNTTHHAKDSDITHLYHPMHMRLTVTSYSEALFFQVLEALKSEAPFYVDIVEYTLKRMDAGTSHRQTQDHHPMNDVDIDFFKERNAPFFTGSIDISVLGLWSDGDAQYTQDTPEHNTHDADDLAHPKHE